MDDFETAKQFFIEGLRLLELNNFQAAETQFARSLELIPARVSTLNNLSVVKLKLKKFAEAEEFARKAVALDDKSPEANGPRPPIMPRELIRSLPFIFNIGQGGFFCIR